MSPKRNIILVLKPGTRRMQYAVLIDGVLFDYGAKYFKGRWSNEKLKKIILTTHLLCEKYQAEGVELNTTHPSRRSQGVNEILFRLRKTYFNIEK